MKVSKADAAAHREALLAAAGTLYRQKGFDGVGMAEIAAAAGLTHGALYSQFASKQALQAETSRELFGWTAAQIEGAPDLAGFLARYLSPTHLDNPGLGCPIAALGGDTARAEPEVRTGYADGLENWITALGPLADASRPQTITAIAALVGAVVLARASGDAALRDEILESVRTELTAILQAA